MLLVSRHQMRDLVRLGLDALTCGPNGFVVYIFDSAKGSEDANDIQLWTSNGSGQAIGAAAPAPANQNQLMKNENTFMLNLLYRGKSA